MRCFVPSWHIKCPFRCKQSTFENQYFFDITSGENWETVAYRFFPWFDYEISHKPRTQQDEGYTETIWHKNDESRVRSDLQLHIYNNASDHIPLQQEEVVQLRANKKNPLTFLDLCETNFSETKLLLSILARASALGMYGVESSIPENNCQLIEARNKNIFSVRERLFSFKFCCIHP